MRLCGIDVSECNRFYLIYNVTICHKNLTNLSKKATSDLSIKLKLLTTTTVITGCHWLIAAHNSVSQDVTQGLQTFVILTDTTIGNMWVNALAGVYSSDDVIARSYDD